MIKALSGLILGAVTGMSNALTIDIYGSEFGRPLEQAEGSYSSTLNEDGNYGSYNYIFYGYNFYGEAIEYFDTVGTQFNFSGESLWGSYNYEFTLSEGEIAWAVYADWAVNYDIPLLHILNCGETPSVGDSCITILTVMQVGPMPGGATGVYGFVSAVPVPPAVWLFCSGLIGLVGFARRKLT